MNGFLHAIPVAATSSLAFAAYTVAAVVFLVAGAQLRLTKALLKKVTDLPPGQRKEVIEIAVDSKLPSKISAGQWIRLKRMRWTFLLVASLLLAVFSVVVIAAFRTNPALSDDRVEFVRKEIVNLRGPWETLDTGNEALEHVFEEAPVLAERITRLEKNLNTGQLIDRDEWGGYAFFMAADAAFRSENKELAGRWIDSAFKRLEMAKSHIAHADQAIQDNPTDNYFSNLQREIDKCYDRERIPYLLAMTLALDRFVRGRGTDKAVIDLVRSLNPQRLKDLEINPVHTPYVREILARASKTS